MVTADMLVKMILPLEAISTSVFATMRIRMTWDVEFVKQLVSNEITSSRSFGAKFGISTNVGSMHTGEGMNIELCLTREAFPALRAEVLCLFVKSQVVSMSVWKR